MINIHITKSGIPGAITVIMAGVHGNEHSGIYAIQDLQKKTSITQGEVIRIIAHLQAYKQKVRYIDVDLNRCFGIEREGHEAQIAREIQKYLNQADYLLDIHNTTTVDSSPFIISEHQEITRILPIEKSLSGLDPLHPGGSDSYMNLLGKTGVCIEVGSIYDKLQPTVNLAKECISSFLQYTGNIRGKNKQTTKQKHYKARSIYYTKSSYHSVYDRQDFNTVSSGTIIGIDGDQNIIAPNDGYILFPKNNTTQGEEAFVRLQKK